ncbi:hypothetical protein I7I51_01125, partial [Histoplasma capsulatum]
WGTSWSYLRIYFRRDMLLVG